jgi:hypothetical protein
VENRLARIDERLSKGARGEERQALQESRSLFERLLETLGEGQPIRTMDLTDDERSEIAGYGLLTLKPFLILLNTGDDSQDPHDLVTYDAPETEILSLQGKLEMELSQLPRDEAEIFMEEFGVTELALPRVIQASYDLIGLHSFFTVSEEEVRAWNLPVGETAVDAAATIHTDLAKGFIRAEVVAYDALIEAGSMAEARKVGNVHLEGKDYVVQDGDVIYIRFSV